MQIANNRIILSSQQYISTILQNLLSIGISEKDIADINSILLLGGFDYYNNDSNNLIINKQSLISMFYNLVDLHTILKKATVLHENPKIILIIYLLYSFFKDDKRYSKDYDDSYKEKSDNNNDTDNEDE